MNLDNDLKFEPSTFGTDSNSLDNITDDDIKVMQFKDTVKQSVLIMSGIKKGDIPEYPTVSAGFDRILKMHKK
jgi:hypothetical protein